MKTKVKLCILAVCLVILIAGGFSIHSTFAYLSNKTGATNKFSVGHVTAEIIEQFRPPTRLKGTGTKWRYGSCICQGMAWVHGC